MAPFFIMDTAFNQDPGTRQYGLTLIELMVVLAVMAVLACLTVPSIAARLPEYRLNRAARDLFSAMQFAKMAAVRENSARAVVFDPAEGVYAVCSDKGGDDTWSTIHDNRVERAFRLRAYGGGVAFGSGRATRPIGGTFDADGVTYRIPCANVLQFNARGTCASGYVYLQNREGAVVGVGTRWTGVVLLRKWHPASEAWR